MKKIQPSLSDLRNTVYGVVLSTYSIEQSILPISLYEDYQTIEN